MKSIRGNRIRKRNDGATLVEMIVTFALLSIFLVAAAAIIGAVTNLYFRIKSETYSKQVSDIILEKVSSEVDGAEYTPRSTIGNPTICDASGNEETSGIGLRMDLYDKTDTHVQVYAENNELIVHYYSLTKDGVEYNATDWKLQESVYNGFMIDSLTFVRGDKLADFTDKSDYGLTSSGSYGSNVIVVFLKLHSERYGDYYTYRFVKMYNVPDTSSSGGGA